MTSRSDSVLPPGDREWLAGLIKSQGDKTDRALTDLAVRVDGVATRLDRLEERQADHERSLRDSKVTDLDHERRIADAHERIASIGAAAGKESAEGVAKKYGAILTLVITAIVTVAQVVQAFRTGAPIPNPPAAVVTPAEK